MGQRKQLHAPLTALAAALLACAGGCATGASGAKGTTAAKRPDVTQPGVLPAPQETLNASPAPGGSVVQTGGTQTAAPAAVVAPVAPPAPSPSVLPKFSRLPEKKVIATDMAVAWQNKIDFLPDPARNGAMGAGLVGQWFLFGGPKLEFVLADGILTIDLIDETPRPAGQPAATPERWQFNKEQLRGLRTSNETFGKSYVLFLPWPGYRPDITRVKISARYDPETGDTLFTQPSVVSLTTEAPAWDVSKTTTTAVVAPGLQPRRIDERGALPVAPGSGRPIPGIGSPIPLGAGSGAAPPAGALQSGALPPGAGGMAPVAPASAPPASAAPMAPAVPQQPGGMIVIPRP